MALVPLTAFFKSKLVNSTIVFLLFSVASLYLCCFVCVGFVGERNVVCSYGPSAILDGQIEFPHIHQ